MPIVYASEDGSAIKYPQSMYFLRNRASIEVDADAYRSVYLEEIEQFRTRYARECRAIGIDYVPLDTSMQFDLRHATMVGLGYFHQDTLAAP